MRKYFGILVFALCSIGTLKGQTASDSLAIVSAQWEIVHSQKGIICKSASIPQLYQCPQVINLIEIDPGRGMKTGIALSDGMKKTSRIASEHHALAAINGSYFDMKHGNSVCFLKTGRQVMDTTTISEFKLRVTGAVYERKGKMKLIPWNRKIEKEYKRKAGTVLAAGPLLLKDGRVCDWSLCGPDFVRTKHPRSAVCMTKDGKILLVTVNGRFPGRAEGVNIPELAHLLRILGGKDALNLDGGGSTTLWLSGAPENGVVNYPCDNKRFDHAGERGVSNIIYVYE
ncbi:phosphodiester glycosidase family protein [Bacteroides sp. AN502(2024)]|uniref:phosphodiester glycosidase family protein n=1 Tax=Bacteroides sp. AN502(2024) TaxID=3160599 RepID=UPI003519274A